MYYLNIIVDRCCYNHDICYINKYQKQYDCDNNFCKCLYESSECFLTKVCIYFILKNFIIFKNLLCWSVKIFGEQFKEQEKQKKNFTSN